MNLINPKTFIFIGRSGCGKGTQANLLIEYLKKNTTNSLFYLESGAKFREFISSSSYTAQIANDYMKEGKLQPSFLAVHIWSHLMIEQMKEDKQLIIDGNPRTLIEAQMLDGAFKFYNRVKPIIIFMNISREWSIDKLSKRGRADDKTVGDINKRLDWFNRDVMPAVEFYRNNPDYIFLDINGERTIQEIHEDIISRIK